MPVGGRAGRCSRAGDGSTASQYAVGVDAWTELSQAEYDDVWTHLDEYSRFVRARIPRIGRASGSPPPSRTYHVDPLDEDDLCDSALRAFETCVPRGDRMYALDWQHSSYWFDPHVPSGEEWFVPVLPNGDYYILDPS
jgi:Protein of unknown function (DUF2716)